MSGATEDRCARVLGPRGCWAGVALGGAASGGLAVAAALAGWRWGTGVGIGCAAALVFALGLPVGASLVCATHALTGGRWGRELRAAGPAARSAWLLIPLAAPAVLAGPAPYPWVAAEATGYFDTTWVALRAAVFLGLWVLVGQVLTRSPRAEAWAGPGVVILLVSLTGAGYDWVLSLPPEFGSTAFGLDLFVSAALTGFAALVGLALLQGESDPALRRDWGTLLLALVALHAYVGYFQWLIVLSGDLPRPGGWYRLRLADPWGTLAALYVGLGLALPLLLLPFRALTQHPRALGAVCALVLLGRALECAWWILPAGGGSALARGVSGALCILGSCGAWLAVLGWTWRRRAQ
ncbi:MAG: hypothetical protein R3F62_25365 [Planctomycetota bacterium]